MIAFAGVVFLSLWLQARESFEFRVDVNRIHVDVFVSGDSKGGMSPDRFEVYDNGAPQRIDIVDRASVPRAFAILLDESGSIRGRRRELLHQAVQKLASRLDESDELALLSFGRRTRLRKPLGVEKPAEGIAAYAIGEGGMTALNDALLLTMSYLRTARGRPFLVAFTDGVDNASWIDETSVLEAGRLSEVVVYAIRAEVTGDVRDGPGNLVAGGNSGRSIAMLSELARTTGGRVIEASNAEAISEAFDAILSEVTARYVLVFTPSGDAEPGWHEVRVKVKGVRDADVRARAGYFLPRDRR